MLKYYYSLKYLLYIGIYDTCTVILLSLIILYRIVIKGFNWVKYIYTENVIL